MLGNPAFYAGHRRRLRHLRGLPPPGAASPRPRSGSSATRAAWRPTGKTFYSASPGTETIVAVDISNPSLPVPLWLGNYDSHGLSISDDGNRAYVAGHRLGADHPRHLRDPGARARTRQVARGRPPDVGLDEHPAERDPGDDRRPPLRRRDRRVRRPERRSAPGGSSTSATRPTRRWSRTCASRSTSPRTSPRSPATRARSARSRATPATTATCRQRVDPGIVACSMILSGLRVFDIRDPQQPAGDRLLQRADRRRADRPAFEAEQLRDVEPVVRPRARRDLVLGRLPAASTRSRLTNGVWPFPGVLEGARAAVSTIAATRLGATRNRRRRRERRAQGPLSGSTAQGRAPTSCSRGDATG